MLKKCILKNFESYKEETVFDLTATKYEMLKNENTLNGICKGAMIVGANASGKSKLIQGISVLLDILFKDNVELSALHSCLFANLPLIELQYEFLIDNKDIIYSLCVDKRGLIIKENLCIDNKNVLVREGLNASLYLISKKTFDNTQVAKSIPFLRTAFFNGLLINSQEITDLMAFLNNSIYINAQARVIINYKKDGMVPLKNLEQADIEQINSYLESLNIEFSLSKKNVKIENPALNGNLINGLNSPILLLTRKPYNFTFSLNMESTGNVTLLSLLPAFIYANQHNCLLLIDEFSSGFHNLLEEKLILKFMEMSKNSQLIFSSHSTNLLDSRILRPDQIYAVNFDKNGSHVIRFSDESPRESQNFEKMYLSGKFGGLPLYEDKD